LERIVAVPPTPRTTAAAVSSQLLSIPRMVRGADMIRGLDCLRLEYSQVTLGRNRHNGW
jgi:hypothetical protein